MLVGPQSGGELFADLDGMEVRLRVPAGAVQQPQIVGLESMSGQSTPVGLSTVGTPFAVRVFERDGTGVDAYEFAAPVELIVRFDGEVQGEGFPLDIGLHYLQGGKAQWLALPATVDPTITQLTASVVQAGTYALLSSASTPALEYPFYMPFIDR